jgi:type IV pilus assembly protein PilB
VIFKRGQKQSRDDDDDDDDDEDEEDEDDREYVLFQGATNGVNPDLQANTRLLQVGLKPAKTLITDALESRSEMIRLEPKGQVAQAAFFVDGVPSNAQRFPGQLALAITQTLKLLGGMDPKQKAKAQAGGLNAEFNGKKYEIRLDTAPLQGGAERLIVRIRDKAFKLEKPEEIGFSDALKKKIREYTSQKHGLYLATGMPNTGVTTVMTGMLRSVDAYLYSLYSIGDLGGRDLAHVATMEWVEGDDLLKTITRCKRKEADVIYIDPIRDAEYARQALEGAEQAAIMAEFPAKDAPDAITRFVQLVKNPQLVAERLKIVCCQKLIRVLCPKCKQAYRPNPKLLLKVGLPPETKVLYRPPRPPEDDDEDDEEPEVCKRCGGTGYLGRTALIEAIDMTEGFRKVVLAGADPAAVRAQAKQDKMQSYQSDGLRLVLEGKTSLEELQRILKAE